MQHHDSTSFSITTNRTSERGAALITALLFSLLILTAGGALVMTTAMSVGNAYDTAAEMEAYYAAEAGMQATLNVLRGNVAPNPLFIANPTGAVAEANKITFRKAVTRADSNKSTDATTLPVRLSRWLDYSATHSDRVIVGDAATYSPISGKAYKVAVSDPDNSNLINFTPSGVFPDPPPATTSTLIKQIGSGNDYIIVTYSAPTTTPVALNGGGTDVLLGRIKVFRKGDPTIAPTYFTLTINQTAPFAATETIECVIQSSGAVGSSTSPNNLTIGFATDGVRAGGVIYKLKNLQPSSPLKTLSLNVPAKNNELTTDIRADVTPPQPKRLVVDVTGLGPRAAQKQMQMMVNRSMFEIDAPAPIVIRGASDNATQMTFALGNSNAKQYTGVDSAGVMPQTPTVAINLHDWTPGDNGIVKDGTVANPQLSILDINTIPSNWATTLSPAPSMKPPKAKTPDFLVTADAARAFLAEAKETALQLGTYRTSLSGLAGSNNPYIPQFTFVDGNCTLDGGAGMLIVTGHLELNGNDDFKGIILVLGNGTVTRSGGGNGNIRGSWIIAKFDSTPGATTGFLAPSFNVSGGGNSNFQRDSVAERDANNTLGRRVVGVVER